MACTHGEAVGWRSDRWNLFVDRIFFGGKGNTIANKQAGNWAKDNIRGRAFDEPSKQPGLISGFFY